MKVSFRRSLAPLTVQLVTMPCYESCSKFSVFHKATIFLESSAKTYVKQSSMYVVKGHIVSYVGKKCRRQASLESGSTHQ